MEITSLLVTCKLSDGSVREIITNREIEIELLKTLLYNSPGGIRVSNEPIIGMDIILPMGEKNLAEYIDYSL